MNLKLTMLSASCALVLAACGGSEAPPPAQDTTTPATTPPATAPVDTAPAGTTPGTTAPATDQPPVSDDMAPADPAGADAGVDAATDAPVTAGDAAVVEDCSTTIEGNDAMQFNVDSITVPASCSDFTINLEHVGQLPVAAMGHNVVVTTAADMQAVAADGLAAGADNDYVKPDDERVIAHTEMVGGGESTSVTFAVSDIQGDGPYEFFCSFPGHSALMKGTIQVSG